MQINGTSTGSTMAASEPPEPPPRNPERINASLHKLSESKTVKSLDSTASSIGIIDKSANNNKALRPILSLDNNTCSGSGSGIGSSTTNTSSHQIGSNKNGSVAGANIVPMATAQHLNSPSNPTLHFNKRSDLTTALPPPPLTTTTTTTATATISTIIPSTTSNESSSPLSSNGSNHTLTSPMTIDNQLQQQHHQQSQPQPQQQQQRLSYINNKQATDAATTSSLHMTQQQQQINGTQRIGVCASSGGGLLHTNKSHNEQSQQSHLINGANGAIGASASAAIACSGGGGGGGEALNVNNCNAIIGNHFNQQTPLTTATTSDSPNKLREENERLSAELTRLRKLLELSPEGAVGGIDLSDSNSCGDAPSTDGSGSATHQQRADRLEAELRAARSQLMSLRIERKKLRSDKGELLGQVKQLCASLQEKEQQLRDFIRNFQERVRETESNNAKLSGDRERERWQLLKQARDEAERSLALAQQLNARDMQLLRLQEQLQEARRQLSGYLSDQESLLSFAPLTPPSATPNLMNHMSATTTTGGTIRADDSGRGNSLSAFSGSSGATAGDRNSCSNDSVLRNNSDRESTGGDMNFSDGTCENGPCITVDPDSISLVSSQNMYQYGTPKERSPTLSPLNSAAYSRSVEQLGSPVDPDGPSGAVARKLAPKAAATGTLGARNGRGGTWGSISRVFARSRNKSKALSADGTIDYSEYSWNPLSEEGYAEKLRLLREASQLPMDRWRATQVLAWLEVALGMPQYSTRCAENVKSGKVLLELSDAELEAGLGLAHPMHRKKLRLAIEEQRRPEMVRYPMITQLGHTWVASEWLPDIGLPQYAESFLHSLVDARMLDTLSKKELEKFLAVTRKFHQASIVHGIHVLRIVKYDRQTLALRRVQSETVDTDPIVWTNQRFIRWARSIDLGEYADNLKDSGVHGGLVVLEPSFSGDTMATALGIPPSKNIIRRHLTTEFDTLILPARATLGQGIRSGCGIVPITGPGGLQHYATADRRSSGSLRISAWKGSQSSLSKAFRFNSKSNRSISSIGDRTSYGNSTSPTPSYSSSEGCGGIYATIGTSSSNHHSHNRQHQQHHQHQHHLPPPTTAPPPPPTAFNYGQKQQQHNIPGSRVSAPPVAGSRSTLDSISDTNLFCEQQQQRRVKSISDIGGVTATASMPPPTDAMATTKSLTKTGTMHSVISVGSVGSIGSGSFGGNGIRSASLSSNSPI